MHSPPSQADRIRLAGDQWGRSRRAVSRSPKRPTPVGGESAAVAAVWDRAGRCQATDASHRIGFRVPTRATGHMEVGATTKPGAGHGKCNFIGDKSPFLTSVGGWPDDSRCDAIDAGVGQQSGISARSLALSLSQSETEQGLQQLSPVIGWSRLLEPKVAPAVRTRAWGPLSPY